MKQTLKGQYVVLENAFELTFIILETFFHNWINRLFSEENKVPETLFEVRNVAGSTT